MKQSSVKNIVKRAVSAMLCAALLLWACPEAFAMESQREFMPERRTVRVAFPSQSGMSEIGEGGDLLGYNYIYLQNIAECTGWNIEYVTYENESSDEGIMDAMKMVMSGEADLIGPILRSEAVEKMFEFPENNYGVVYTTLCSLDESKVASVNFKKYSPLRVAVYNGADTRNKEVQEYLDLQGVEYEMIYCETTEEQLKMLKDKKADVLSSITLSYFMETHAVAEFAPRPYYFVSTKGNAHLMEELDEAIETLNYTKPYLQEQLQQQYFGDTSEGYNLSEDELEYINELGPLHILCAPDYAPYSSMSNDGKPVGMLVSLLDDFAKDNKISIDYTFCDDMKSMEKAWSTGDYNCMIGLPFTSDYCAKNGMIRTAPVVSVSIVLFGKQQTKKAPEESTVAVYAQLADQLNLNAFGKVVKCATLGECYSAVEKGKADYGCANRLSADYEIFERNSSFVSMPLLGEQLDLSIAVSRRMDSRFLSALNKYINTLPDSTLTAYLSEASRHEDVQSLKAFIRTRPVHAAGIFSAIAILFISSVMFAINARKNRKRNVELQHANSAKSEFLSRMSHDIRTPMNAILGFAELGKQDINSPEQLKEDLERISSSGEFLLGLVNDVLDMTKIESQAMELKPQSYPKAEFKEQIETLVGPLCASKNIKFTTYFDENMPECLYVDRLRFNQIFFNLLSNAVKFTPENGCIEMSSERLGEKDGRVMMRFKVQDNGIGMSEEFQKKMFESFSQEQQHISGQEGTGLGLSIVKSIVELMNGTISVSSKLGEGSAFIVELPVETCEMPYPERASEKDSQNSSLKGRNILLCEDHPVNTKLVCRLLNKVGVNVTCATNGQEGVNTFEASIPGFFDAILMDIRMPVMDGIEASRTIRALNREDAKVVPIIAITANAFDDDVQKCRDAGMNAHLAKPFNVDVMYNTLKVQIKH